MTLLATTHPSGFPLAHDTYNGLSTGSDGKIYYVLSSQDFDQGGKMYCFDPATKRTHCCGDLTEACGEKGMKTIVQGKSHVRFSEYNGKLYFATHVGYYTLIDGMERMGVPPPGYKNYPGGHILSYDMKSGKFDDLAMAPRQEGIITMSMDTDRGIIFGITWPTGYFFSYDLSALRWNEIGPVDGEGENGNAVNFRSICRSIAIDPSDGAAYLTTPDGTILRYRTNQERLEPLEENMRKDYFGRYDPHLPGHMGYHWRQVIWYPGDRSFYGVHGNSGYLFRLDTKSWQLSVLDRLTSVPSQQSGMFDQFSYGYLGLVLGPDQRTLYYLTGGPIYENGRRITGKNQTAKGEAKGLENLHLVTYDIPDRRYRDHGPVFFADGGRPTYVNSITVGTDGTVYALARITENGMTDLVSMEVQGPKFKVQG